MPQALVLLQAAQYWIAGQIGGAAAAVTGSTAIGGAVATAVHYGLGIGAQVGVATALTAATMPRPEVAQVNLKQPDPPRVRAYGQVRLGGPYAFWEAKGNWAGDVIMLHDGEVFEFGQVYLFDDPVQVEGDGDVISPGQGKYPTGFVNLSFRKGLFTETVHANVAAQFSEWTADHRGDGIASIGMVCGHGKMEEFQNRYPNGEPNVSVVTKAQYVFDPRDGTQDVSDPSTWEWSDNAALCHLHWEFFDQRRAYDDEIDGSGRLVQVFNEEKWNRLFAPNLAMWIEAANVCDEAVTLKAGGTIPRYTLGAIYQEGQTPDQIRRQFLACYDGWMSPDGSGAITVYAGEYIEPTVTLGDDDIDDYTFQRNVEDEQSVNVLSIRFTDPETDYGTAEPTPWRDEADILARGGLERVETLELPWVQSASQARRLAKRVMAKHQARARGSIKCKMTDNALAALGKRYVNIAISETVTLSSLPVEIMRAEIDLMSMSIFLDWIAADPNIDEWDAAEEEGDPPSTEERPEGEGVPAPVDLTVEAIFESAGAGGQGARLVFTFDDPDREDLTYIVRWKVAVDTAYNYETFSTAEISGPSLVVKSGFVPADVTIDASIAFVGGAGGQGDWYAPDVEVDTTTAGLSPGPVAAVAAANGAGQSVITWTNPPSILFASAKVYRANAGQVFADAVAVSGDIAGAPSAVGTYTNTGVSAGSYLYWVVAKSTAGVPATPAGPDAATIT